MSSTQHRSEESVIVIELLFLLLVIAVLRLLLAPMSRSLTSVMVVWFLLTASSYLVGEFETVVRVNFGLSLRTQAAFALSYVAYSGIHVIWPWCEELTVRFWLALWLYLNFLAPVLGLLVRRLIRQRAVLVTSRHRDRVPLLRWWGFECSETVEPSQLGAWLSQKADEYGRLPNCEVVVVDVTDERTEYEVVRLVDRYFADFVAVPSFTMSAYLTGPHPRHAAPFSLHTVVRRLKRVVDLVLSTVAVVLLSPVFVVAAILIKLTSPGTVFYRHRRLGRNMRGFWLLKFRTMYSDADQRLHRILDADPKLDLEFKRTFKLRNDPRITRVGRLLRRLSIDELPQFFNILTGQMSLVGPRPVVLDEVKYYRDHSLLRFRVLPGATGLWQVSGRSETSYQERVEMDTRYVREWTLLWDLRIIMSTIPAVLRRRGAY